MSRGLIFFFEEKSQPYAYLSSKAICPSRSFLCLGRTRNQVTGTGGTLEAFASWFNRATFGRYPTRPFNTLLSSSFEEETFSTQTIVSTHVTFFNSNINFERLFNYLNLVWPYHWVIASSCPAQRRTSPSITSKLCNSNRSTWSLVLCAHVNVKRIVLLICEINALGASC